MRPRVPARFARLLVLAYALVAVLGVNLVLCVEPGGHQAIELGALGCCDGTPSESDAGALHPASEEHGCGPCTDHELVPDPGLQLRAPAFAARLALAAWPGADGACTSARPGRWAVVQPSLPPPDDGRRGLVLRC